MLLALEPDHAAARRRTGRLMGAVLVLLAATSGTAFAQYHIDTWTTENGLPQATVFSVRQAPNGFLWISTYGGLVRFDGVNFRTFDTASNPELPNSRLAAVTADPEGNVWVSTQDRVLMRFHGGKFEVMGMANGLPTTTVGRYAVENGRLWVETTAGRFLWQGERFVPDTRRPPPGSAGMTWIGDSAGTAKWYADAARVAHRFDQDRETRTLALPPHVADRVYEDRAGRLWMRDSSDNTLLCADGDTIHAYRFSDILIRIDTMWVLDDPDGTLWFAEPSGLARFRDGRFTAFTKANGLPDNYVNSVYRDREGSLWVATQGGLARLTQQPVTSYSKADGLAADNTYPILQDRNGDVWIGGWAGLTRFHDGTFEDQSSLLGGRRNVLSLFEDRDGFLWVGTWGPGVWRIDLHGDRRPQFFSERPVPSVTFAIYQGRGPDIWFGTERGAMRFHDGVFDRPLGGGAVNVFHEDADGTLWMGTDAGLSKYDHGVLSPVGDKEGFGGRRVRVIYPDTDGTLWIGTYDTGLFRYRDGRFTRFTTRDGLPTNGAFQILEDKQARFWISSNVGIYRVAKSQLNELAAGRRRHVDAVPYGRDEGMANQEANGLGRPAGILATDGRLWFPTQGGVAVIDSGGGALLPPPPVSILEVIVDGVPAASGDRIEIHSRRAQIEVRYAALTFVRPELVRFKYRIDGINDDWVDAGNGRAVRFASLPFGALRFRVTAANREGVWNPAGAGLEIDVIPPFWQTSWFMALMIGLVMATGFGAHRVRLRVLERRQALQEAFARQLIDSQETDRKRIASELHDGVSQTLVVIRNWASIGAPAQPEDSAGRRRLGEIADAASQALGEVREVVQDLLPYHLERLGLVEAIREAAGRVADASGIPIECRLGDVQGQLSAVTSLRLFRVMQEGLNNMVKHSRATKASIDLVGESGRVRLTIRDNGRGFVPNAVTPTEPGHGFGLVGMSERARMMGGEIAIESSPGRGTSITISVPSVDSHSHR